MGPALVLLLVAVGCGSQTPQSPAASQAPVSQPTAAPSSSEPVNGPGTSSTPVGSADPASNRAPFGYAVELVIPSLDVDLAVIEGQMDSAGNPQFPLCDVAQYMPYYVQPGAIGTTYLYAHARKGMLLSLLDASEVNDGQQLLGQAVNVYTSGGWRFDYTIDIVKRHVTDYSLADDIAPGEQQLIVQTSEGLADDPNKLQVAAQPAGSEQVGEVDVPSASPRVCVPGGS